MPNHSVFSRLVGILLIVRELLKNMSDGTRFKYQNPIDVDRK